MIPNILKISLYDTRVKLRFDPEILKIKILAEPPPDFGLHARRGIGAGRGAGAPAQTIPVDPAPRHRFSPNGTIPPCIGANYISESKALASVGVVIGVARSAISAPSSLARSRNSATDISCSGISAPRRS